MSQGTTLCENFLRKFNCASNNDFLSVNINSVKIRARSLNLKRVFFHPVGYVNSEDEERSSPQHPVFVDINMSNRVIAGTVF